MAAQHCVSTKQTMAAAVFLAFTFDFIMFHPT